MLVAYKELKEPINQHNHGNHLRNQLVSWDKVRRTKPWVTILLYPRARKWLPKIIKFRGLPFTTLDYCNRDDFAAYQLL